MVREFLERDTCKMTGVNISNGFNQSNLSISIQEWWFILFVSLNLSIKSKLSVYEVEGWEAVWNALWEVRLFWPHYRNWLKLGLVYLEMSIPFVKVATCNVFSSLDIIVSHWMFITTNRPPCTSSTASDVAGAEANKDITFVFIMSVLWTM